jgi:hypothetical protein
VTDLTTEALAGGWEAFLADSYGFVTDIDDIDLGEARIVIVRRTASPPGPDADMEQRLPGAHNSEDKLVEWDDFDHLDDVRARWAQAQAMAAGLNNAAEEANR